MGIAVVEVKTRMKSLINTKIFWCIYLCYSLMALWAAFTFRFNLILDLCWSKVDQTEIQEKEEYDGSLAGLPAGEGVTGLTDIDQFYELQVRGFDRSNCEGWWDSESVIIVHPEYITFETDSIIPLGLYRLNSKEDGHSSGYWRRGRYVHSEVSISECTDSGFLGAFFWYNQYYLVRLPDGNYVPAHLDDAYYIKYRLTGKVQLPLGVAISKDSDDWRDLQPYLEEYGVSNERILDMYCEKRYEDWSILYHVFVLLAWPVLLFIGVNCGALIEALILKKPVIQHLKGYWQKKPDGRGRRTGDGN